MRVLSYIKARQTLAELMRMVNSDHTPIHVTQKSGHDVVIMSKADYDSIEETICLLSNPSNARRLNDSIRELETGRGTEKELIET